MTMVAESSTTKIVIAIRAPRAFPARSTSSRARHDCLGAIPVEIRPSPPGPAGRSVCSSEKNLPGLTGPSARASESSAAGGIVLQFLRCSASHRPRRFPHSGSAPPDKVLISARADSVADLPRHRQKMNSLAATKRRPVSDHLIFATRILLLAARSVFASEIDFVFWLTSMFLLSAFR